MHSNEAKHDCLTAVLTAQEAATLWGLSRNAVSDACRRGALRGRKSGQIWLVTVADMLAYEKGRYWPDLIPEALEPALEQALASLKKDAK
jgi:hypothetical protein